MELKTLNDLEKHGIRFDYEYVVNIRFMQTDLHKSGRQHAGKDRRAPRQVRDPGCRLFTVVRLDSVFL